MEDQRDLISNHEQLPMLGQRPAAQERWVCAAGEGTRTLGCADVQRCWEGAPDPGPGGVELGSDLNNVWVILNESLACPGLQFSLL